MTLKRFDVGEITSHILCSPLHELRKRQSCRFCDAKRFQYEPPSFCCYNGQVVLFVPRVPKDLYKLYTTQSEEALEFRWHIRTYNSIFSFTSFGVKSLQVQEKEFIYFEHKNKYIITSHLYYH